MSEFPNLPTTTQPSVNGMPGQQIGPVPMQTAQPTSGQATIQQLMERYNDLSTKITEQTKKAINPQPVAGGLTPSVGGRMNVSFGQPQFRAPEGHADARNQGIAKTVAGVGNLVSMFIKHKQDSEQRVLAGQIHGIMDANDSISQAKQVLQADPNNAEAKATLEKASQHINDAFKDPKTAKKLEKAFDINQIDPSKNDAPEHKALQQATKSYAEQLQEKQNQKMQANVLEKQKLDLLQQQQQAVAMQYKAALPQAIQEQKMAQQSAIQQNAINAKNRQIEFQTQHEDYNKQQQQANENMRKLADIQKDIKVAGMRDGTMLQATAMRIAGQQSLYKQRLEAVKQAGDKPAAKMRVMLAYQKELQDTAEKADKQIEANNKLANSSGVKKADTQEKYYESNRQWETAKVAAESNLKALSTQMAYYSKNGVLPDEDADKMPEAPSGLEDDKEISQYLEP